MNTSSRLNVLERLLLVVPLLAGLFFGLFPLLVPAAFASVTFGIPATDPYIYRLAGAATFGYAVALAFGLRQGTWAAVRLIVVAVLTFNLASLYACAIEIASPSTSGGTKPVVYLILAASIVLIAISATLLYRHRNVAKLAPDIASWVVTFIVIATILATIFGLIPLFYPQLFQLFGYKVKDLFLYRQAGAATLGYAIMGIFELRSRSWQEIRWPNVMAAVFNGLSFLASLLSLALGEPYLFPALIAIATLGVTTAAIVALRTNGGSSSEKLATTLASH